MSFVCCVCVGIKALHKLFELSGGVSSMNGGNCGNQYYSTKKIFPFSHNQNLHKCKIKLFILLQY